MQGIDINSVEQDKRFSLVNILMYINTHLINEMYMKFTNEVGIKDKPGSLIVMDNELFYERIMMTRNKKNYAGVVKLKESHKVDYLDMKGLAIRKVSTNSKARDVFENILDEDILRTRDINIPKIVRKYKQLEQDIYDSLASGSAEFGTPGKANSAANYKFPYTMAPFRGALLWNKLFPEEEIVFSARVIMIKLNITSVDEIYEKVENEHYRNILEDVFNDEDMLIGGRINTISLPDGTKRIPDFLVPFVDIDTIVNNTIKPGLIMLESLGIQLVGTSNGSYPSTIISL